jgi:hypothetical protein
MAQHAELIRDSVRVQAPITVPLAAIQVEVSVPPAS